jgi:hypothetical protein
MRLILFSMLLAGCGHGFSSNCGIVVAGDIDSRF